MELIDWQRQTAECLAQDKYPEAIALYHKCIEANPNELYNYWRLGVALLLIGKESEAQSIWYSVLLQLNLEEFEAATAELIQVLDAEGFQRLQSGQLNQAERIYWQIIEQDSTNIEAYKNLGHALLKQGKLDEAIACYQQALTLAPNDATLYYQLGLVLHKQGKLEEAIAYYQQCLTLNPAQATAYYNQGYAFQMQGKLEQFDVHAPLLSLPRILGTTLETVPAQIPYLNLSQSPSLRLETLPGTYLKVGIVWAGNPMHRANRSRSCSLNHFLSILDIPSIAFYSLQKGAPVEELTQLSSKVPLQDLNSQL
jgi:tetratricopeptide (TPR) repeat protein